MKCALAQQFTVLLVPLAVLPQVKPGATDATNAAKRIWGSASGEKRAPWQHLRETLTRSDISDDTKRQVITARGSPQPGEYHEHRDDGDVGGQQGNILRLDYRRRRPGGADGAQR